MSFNVQNKIALVTGANRGIGKVIVETLLNRGASKVYLAVRDTQSTQALQQAYGEKVVTLQADLSDAESIKALAAQTKDVHLVVNNAGVLKTASSLAEDAIDALKFEMEINAYGLLRVAQAFEQTLVANRGALVQLNSIASIKNFAELSTYSASKAASYSLTQGLRDQFAKHDVQVLSVHPGPIGTDMGKDAGFDDEMVASTNVVADGIVDALAEGAFHLFPDAMAKQFEAAYQSYADNIVMAQISE